MNSKERILIHIPADENYIEILGFKIDGFNSFEAFLKHLEKYAKLEEENNLLKDEKECLIDTQKNLQKILSESIAEANKLTYQVNRLKKHDEERDIRLHARLTETARAEAIKEVLLQLEAEAESSDKYIQEYDDSETQKAYNKGLWTAYNLVKEMVGDAE